MYYLYKITGTKTKNIYVGMTKNPDARWRSHIHAAKSKKNKLYDCMRRHGAETFSMEVLSSYGTFDECAQAEADAIESIGSLNIAAGGEGGYVVPINKREDWIRKLKVARRGKKPALGMKHTEENKRLFSEVAKAYWSEQDTYNLEDVTSVPFKEANKVYGISKTHYYRLKRSLTSDQ